MKIKYRIAVVLIAYAAIILLGIYFMNKLDAQLSPKVFEDPRLNIRTFLDDYIEIEFSCPGNTTNASFAVYDEYGNLWHNSSYILCCNTFNKLDLQGSPQDYLTGRKYIVYARFNNETINSGYFEFARYSFFGLVKRETIAFFSFMIYQNRLARGSYCDKQRFLWVNTHDEIYGKNYMLCHTVGIFSTFNVLLTINILIWIGYFIYNGLKRKKKS